MITTVANRAADTVVEADKNSMEVVSNKAMVEVGKAIMDNKIMAVVANKAVATVAEVDRNSTVSKVDMVEVNSSTSRL